MSERERFEAAYAAIPTITPTKETAWLVWQAARSRQAASGSSQGARSDRTRSQKLADAGFTRRPSLWALQAREALELIAAPQRADGSWNRDREACRQLAAEALGRDTDSDVQNGVGVGQPEAPTAAPLEPVACIQHFPGFADRVFMLAQHDPRKFAPVSDVTYTMLYAHPPARSGAKES